MEISDAGLKFLEHEEGTVLHVYRDAVGLPTTGTGHLIVPAGGPHIGDTISQEVPGAFLRADLAKVYQCIAHVVTVPLNQNQFDALCSLIFNIGVRAFAHSQSVLANLNAGDYEACAEGFLEWKN